MFSVSGRGGQTWILKEIAVMVLVAIIIIATVTFFNKVWAVFNSKKDDGSIANFDRLYNDVKDLLESPDAMAYKLDPFFIGSGKILMGFDTNWDDQKNSVVGTLFNAYKPFKCGNGACICLYTSDWKPNDPAKRDQGVVSCRSEAFRDKDIAFISEGSDVKPKTSGTKRTDIKGNYFVFYGNEWKSQYLYIEKFSSGSRTYIYVSSIDVNNDNDPANIRKKSIDNSKR